MVRWHVQHGIAVIPKSSRRARIVSNADVAGLAPTETETQALDGVGGQPA